MPCLTSTFLMSAPRRATPVCWSTKRGSPARPACCSVSTAGNILGAIFEISDAVGAELLDISRDTFRQRLARARRDLHSFMNDKCGLVNRANPCRCAKKTRGFIEAGYVDPENLLFARDHISQVREAVPKAFE